MLNAVAFIAAEDISAGDVVYLDDDGKLRRYVPDAPRCIGTFPVDATKGDEVQVPSHVAYPHTR